MATQIKLNKAWVLGDEIGGGGFGSVFEARSGEEVAAVKLVPKDSGAERELLFEDLGDVDNVTPIIDSGETENSWVIVMPLAETSLRKELQDAGGKFTVSATAGVASDVLEALSGLDGRVVHRDLKPENVLRVDGRWCLADFGISRYAEATTATDTRKFAMSAPYAAPERWRNETATAATDIYSLGVMLHEMLSGTLPFAGPTTEDFREQHLHDSPPELTDVPDSLIALVLECLYKSPQARPRAANLSERIAGSGIIMVSGGVASLEAANRSAVAKRGEAELEASRAQTAAARRSELAEDAEKALERIGGSLKKLILGAAPAASVSGTGDVGWTVTLQGATLGFDSPRRHQSGAQEVFDIVVSSAIQLQIAADTYGYQGRSHSLWFCDSQVEGEYQWFETAFMVMPLMREDSSLKPFALDPGEEARQALGSAMGIRQVAWPFTVLEPGNLDDLLDRWARWFGEAASDSLSAPSGMPELPTGSWRRS